MPSEAGNLLTVPSGWRTSSMPFSASRSRRLILSLSATASPVSLVVAPFQLLGDRLPPRFFLLLAYHALSYEGFELQEFRSHLAAPTGFRVGIGCVHAVFEPPNAPFYAPHPSSRSPAGVSSEGLSVKL